MTPGVWFAIIGLTVILATVLWARMVHGKPRAWRILMMVCLASGIWHLATAPVFSWHWVFGGLIGFVLALVAIVMHSTRRTA
jgi:hypothetical protein